MMGNTKKFCIHSDGLGYCDILSDDKTRQYCVEGPCPHEKLVEYEPVRHGRWVLNSRIHQLFDDVDEEFYVECNLCKREEYVPFELEEKKMLDYAKQNYPYCHCGARMDGESE